MQVYPPWKLKVFVDDITTFMEGRNLELPGIAGKGADVKKEGGRRDRFEAVDHERRKSRKIEGACVMQLLERTNALQLFEEGIAGAMWILLSTSGLFSSKDVWRSHSRLPRPSSQGQSGVACIVLQDA